LPGLAVRAAFGRAGLAEAGFAAAEDLAGADVAAFAAVFEARLGVGALLLSVTARSLA
jgi:hypothetical protein